MSLVKAVRKDLSQPSLKWFISQQTPPDHESVNRVDVMSEMAQATSDDPNNIHIKLLDLPPQREQLVIEAAGTVWLGERLAQEFLSTP